MTDSLKINHHRRYDQDSWRFGNARERFQSSHLKLRMPSRQSQASKLDSPCRLLQYRVSGLCGLSCTYLLIGCSSSFCNASAPANFHQCLTLVFCAILHKILINGKVAGWMNDDDGLLALVWRNTGVKVERHTEPPYLNPPKHCPRRICAPCSSTPDT
jgi:hypothetical protein